MRPKILLLLITGILGATGGWWFSNTVLRKDAPSPAAQEAESPDSLLGQRRPDFKLGSSTGAIINASDFDGQVVLVNFWATWCQPCREEMPMLSEVHNRLLADGFQVVGIAMDDVAQARGFLDELGITYPNAVGTVDVMATGVAFGNRSGLLPYSVLIDRQGIVRWVKLGELEQSELEAQLAALLDA